MLLILGMPTEALIVGVITLITLMIVYQFLRKEEPTAVSKGRLFKS